MPTPPSPQDVVDALAMTLEREDLSGVLWCPAADAIALRKWVTDRSASFGTGIRRAIRLARLMAVADGRADYIRFLYERVGPLRARLFRQVLSDPSHPQPRVIHTDQARLYGAAIPAVKEEGILRRRCRHRPVQYLNNILEQDHRANKRRVKAKQNFREFQAARRTIEGYEAMHMIRKGQARWVSGNDVRVRSACLKPPYRVHLGAIPVGIFKVATLPPEVLSASN